MNDIESSYSKYGYKGIISARNELQNRFNIKNYINNDDLYSELCSFIREDVYQNENYTSDGLSNAGIIAKAKDLKAKAEQELSKACMAQYTVTSSISAIVAQKAFEYNGVTVNDDYSKFMVNNYVRVRIDDEIYKMRIASIGLDFPITDRVNVSFTNVSRYHNGAMNDIASILENASNMASSYGYIATQAEKGESASLQFDTIKQEGLNAGLMAVKAGRNQDVLIDNHGILLRKKIEEIDDYSRYQMKIINRNIVMTDDNWLTAKLAIGLGTYKGEPLYGVWADLLVGDLIVGKELNILGDKGQVKIDENGVNIYKGSIRWSVDGEDGIQTPDIGQIPELSEKIFAINQDISTAQSLANSAYSLADAANAYTNSEIFKLNTEVLKYLQGGGTTAIGSSYVISPYIGGGYLNIGGTYGRICIDPDYHEQTGYIFGVWNNNNKMVVGINTSGNGEFSGKVTANEGDIGGWEIESDKLYANGSEGSLYLNSSTGRIIGESKTSNHRFELTTGQGIYLTTYDDPFSKITTLDLSGVHTQGYIYAGDGLQVTGDANFYDGLILTNNQPGYGIKTASGTNIIRGLNTADVYVGGNVATNAIWLGATNIYYTNKAPSQSGSDRRIKHDIKPSDESFVDFIMSLSPCSYKFNDGTSNRTHWGFIADEVEKSMNETTGDSGVFVKIPVDENTEVDLEDDSTYIGGLRYDEFIAPIVATIQSQNERIKKLEETIQQLINTQSINRGDGD